MVSEVKSKVVSSRLYYWQCTEKGCKMVIRNFARGTVIRLADNHLEAHRKKAKAETQEAIRLSRISGAAA